MLKHWKINKAGRWLPLLAVIFLAGCTAPEPIKTVSEPEGKQLDFGKYIDRVIVAGQFGKHLNPESLTGAGLIPASLKERISYIGNSSMMGAHLCLLNQNERRRAEEVAKNIEYIELSVSPGYEKLFTKCLQFECP